MKKLCLIIPLLLPPISLFATDGVDGCLITTGVTMQARLYYTPYTDGLGSPVQWIETSTGHAGYNITTATRCFETTGITCVVYQYGTTGATPPGTAVVYSGFYGQVTTNCPIDDYIPIFFIFTAGFAFFQIRRN
ncbi:hypothetical protein [Pedobacter aquatilis]|uniref:hypothetical protein n=1 Tax=Pedobacter aquatilis TaxID=351343 RepID=UPI00292CEFE2|nr:hypothetical protein [Pedobacter aquatilis]